MMEKLQELIERFDRECICDCPDNRDRHPLDKCPNIKPLADRWEFPRPARNFCRTFDVGYPEIDK